jgi:thiaminase/transcriptional activator TenA
VKDEKADHGKLIRGAGALWLEATTSPFLTAIADGSLGEKALARWLVQDHHFVVGLAAFEGVLSSRLPRPAQSAVIRGLAALDEELDWFAERARTLGLDLAGPVHPVTRRYVDFLLASVHSQSGVGSLAILYGVEASYLAAWSALAPTGPYSEYIARWSSEAFRAHAERLRECAENDCDATSQPLFERVLRHEKDFWDMAANG